MQHSCSHYNAFCSMTWLTRMHLRTWQHQMTAIMQPFQCDLQPQIQETQKHKVSCSGFLPKRKPMAHATFMQPLQCVLQHDVANPHASTHMATADDNNQPFQCDLQPQIQETHRTTHTGTTTRCRTQRRNRLNSKRSKPHPPHTRGTFHRRLKPLYTEKHKVSCSGFLPKRKPMAHATFMQPLQCVLQRDVANPHASTHMATSDDNNHAAIPMRSATTDSRNA